MGGLGVFGDAWSSADESRMGHQKGSKCSKAISAIPRLSHEPFSETHPQEKAAQPSASAPDSPTPLGPSEKQAAEITQASTRLEASRSWLLGAFLFERLRVILHFLAPDGTQIPTDQGKCCPHDISEVAEVREILDRRWIFQLERN